MPNSETNFRPIRVTLLALLMLVIALWNGLRLGQAIFFWKTLQEYGASPWYIVISGGFWLLGGLALAWGARRDYWQYGRLRVLVLV
jgi:hypothetical protein